MRYNLSKTKRRPRSNKKGALKGLRNNKTKVVKKRRIEQRGGGTFPELINFILTNNANAVANCIREEIRPSLYHKFVGRVEEGGNAVFQGNTALYTACRSPDPNVDMVKTLHFFGFKPDTPNNNENGSFPQHGVVAAAQEIMTQGVSDPMKVPKLQKLVLILEELKKNGADMRIKNKVGPTGGYTAFEEYTNPSIDLRTNSTRVSIYNTIQQINPLLSETIGYLLNPNPPSAPPSAPPPPPSVYTDQLPQGALPLCNLQELPDTQQYSIERMRNYSNEFNSKYYFIYNGNNHYFCANINWLIDREFSDSTQAGKPGSINSFRVTYLDTTFNFSYTRPGPSSVGGPFTAYPKGPQHVSFNIEEPRCRIYAKVEMLPES